MGIKQNVSRTSNDVDWSDALLQPLPGRIEGWNLDNREIHSRKQVLIQVDWSASGAKAATLAWTREHAMVLETSFPLTVGEHVRVDIRLGDSTRSVWALVADTREGLRAGDRGNGVHVSWLHAR